MAIQVIDRRNSALFQAVNPNTLKSQQEVVMSKVNAIVVRQVSPAPKNEIDFNSRKSTVNPKQEVKAVKNTERTFSYTRTQLNQLIQEAVAVALGKKSQVLKTNEEVARKQQVMRVQAQTQEVEKPIKVKADMHAAGIKAYGTRIFNQNHKVFEEVARKHEVGTVFSITMDRGLPTEKVLRAKLDSRTKQGAQFRVKVEKRSGKPGIGGVKALESYYLPITISL